MSVISIATDYAYCKGCDETTDMIYSEVSAEGTQLAEGVYLLIYDVYIECAHLFTISICPDVH